MRATISVPLEEALTTTLFGEASLVSSVTSEHVISNVRRQHQLAEVTLGKEVMRWVNVVGKHGQTFDDNGRWLLRTDPMWKPPGFAVTYEERTLCSFGINYDEDETQMMGLRTAWIELHRVTDLDPLAHRGQVVFVESAFKACEAQAVRVQGLLSKFGVEVVHDYSDFLKITFNPFNFGDCSKVRQELIKALEK
jgi:hypothetical protein